MQRTSLKTTLVALVAVLVALAAAPGANAKIAVGIGDQQAAMFDHPGFKKLKIKRVRYFVRWDAMRNKDERLRARAYVKAARAHRKRVLLHISSDNLERRKAKLPKKRRYRKDVTRLVRYFRRLGVREFGARNEANHDSQATWKSPRRAAFEFKVVRRACKRCTIVALDVLDQAGVRSYIRRFYRALGRKHRRYARIVGIHNYSDVNRRRTSGTREIMREARRQNRRVRFWFTETGGVVNFGRSFPCNERRAANRLNYLFRIAKRYRKRIRRLYLYNWTGAGCDARFDAGLTRTDGSLRPGYYVVRKQLRKKLYTR
jgi:hypothetical protein